jgi:hypothetical protein
MDGVFDRFSDYKDTTLRLIFLEHHKADKTLLISASDWILISYLLGTAPISAAGRLSALYGIV